MNVTPQIDVTGTAVSSLNFFRGGLRVLTTGNVHPTAIEAALQLGRHLYVSLHHTGDAVDALGGGPRAINCKSSDPRAETTAGRCFGPQENLRLE